MTTEIHQADTKVYSCDNVAGKGANPFLADSANFVPFVSTISVIQRLDLKSSGNRQSASQIESLGRGERCKVYLTQEAMPARFRCISQREVWIFFEGTLIVAESTGDVSAQLLLISRDQARET